jgi:hypothetical protein
MDLVWLASLFSFFAMDYVRYTAPYGLLENTRQLWACFIPPEAWCCCCYRFNASVQLQRKSRVISGRYKTSHHPPPALSPQTNKPETKRHVIIARNRHLGRVYANRPNLLEHSAERVVYPWWFPIQQLLKDHRKKNVMMPTCMAQIRALRYEQTPIIIIISIIIIIIIIIQG